MDTHTERTSLGVQAIDLGVNDGLQTVCIRHSVQPKMFRESATIVVDATRRDLSLTFPEQLWNGERYYYSFQVPLDQIEQMVVVRAQPGESYFKLVFWLKSPPPLYRQRMAVEDSTGAAAGMWANSHCWQRVTSLSEVENAFFHPVSLAANESPCKFGRWTTYAVHIALRYLRERSYYNFRMALYEQRMTVNDAPNTLRLVNDERASCLDLLAEADADLGKCIVQMPWTVRYQLEVCISQDKLSEYSIDQDFFTAIAHISELDAIRLLENVANSPMRFPKPMDIFRCCSGFKRIQLEVPSHCVLMRQVVVTPSTMYLSSPTVEPSNRVVRQFSQYASRFLRVRFSDEKAEGRLRAIKDDFTDQLFAKVKRTLLQGIVIGGRRFEYLASGNSQFREHGAYFFCSSGSLTADDIRKWIGDFRGLTTVSKYISRMGQGFSTTRPIRENAVSLREAEDITRRGYNFTDGVGKISKFLAQSIANELGYPNSPEPPSVFQFRLGGCKGVLAVAADATASELYIRPSQNKFPAIHDGLEIVRYSSFARADLNRQLIIVLGTLGVADGVFMSMLKDEVDELNESLSSSQTILASLAKHPDGHGVTSLIEKMIRDGFNTAREPFVASLLQLWRSWQLKKIKYKARITIEQSAFLLGCADETGSLQGHYNAESKMNPMQQTAQDHIASLPQIYVRIPDEQIPGKYRSITGPCIVARNPCLHPGDIRVVNAVDVQRLHHLCDVVVFPVAGDRDIPSMCSGGDLDGDDYVVSWNHALLPPRQYWNVPPMTFTGHQAPAKAQITTRDCTDFFANFIKHDNLGRVANAWQAIADSSPFRAYDSRCLELAKLHSVAVDFPKTGVPALVPNDLMPKLYPHYMPSRFRPASKIYRSHSVLGKMHDSVQDVPYRYDFDSTALDSRVISAQIRLPDPADSSSPARGKFLVYDDELQDGMVEETRELMMESAIEIKEEYDVEMRRIMKQHGIETEFEVWSGFVMWHNQAAGDYKFHETITELFSSIKQRFRTACVEVMDDLFNMSSDGSVVDDEYMDLSDDTTSDTEAVAERIKDSYENMAAFVQIMYLVTQYELEEYQEKQKDGGRVARAPLISFPWLFSEYLGRIVRENPLPDGFLTQSPPSGLSRSDRDDLLSLKLDPNVGKVVRQRPGPRSFPIPIKGIRPPTAKSSALPPEINTVSPTSCSTSFSGGASSPSPQKMDIDYDCLTSMSSSLSLSPTEQARPKTSGHASVATQDSAETSPWGSLTLSRTNNSDARCNAAAWTNEETSLPY